MEDYNKGERRTRNKKEGKSVLVLLNGFEKPNSVKMADHIYYLAPKKQGSVNVSTWKYATGSHWLLKHATNMHH